MRSPMRRMKAIARVILLADKMALAAGFCEAARARGAGVHIRRGYRKSAVPLTALRQVGASIGNAAQCRPH